MTRSKQRWLVGLGVFVALGFVGLTIAGYIFAHRFDPYIREQAILYLQERFDSEVELTTLRIDLQRISVLQLIIHGSRAALAHVDGEGLSLRHRSRRDSPPMFAIRKFSSELDIGNLF